MPLTTIAEKIIALPAEFRKPGNKRSIYELLEGTGYFEVHNQLTENVLMKILLQHKEYIDDWQLWSEDKRTDKGWAFQLTDRNSYIVQYFGDAEESTVLEFKGRAEACASYIKKEIENIRAR